MKQVIPFKKELTFKTSIEEITSISLEHNLSLNEENVVSGEFIISGQYKVSETSINLEDFLYSIPFDIAIDDDYDTANVRIDIDDFYYEIEDDSILRVNIEVLVDGLEYREIVEDEPDEADSLDYDDNLRGDDRIMDTEVLISKEEETDRISADEQIKTVFDSFDDSLETFSTYSVYIVKEEDTIESIMIKYSKTMEELEAYNDLSEVKVGTKLIIPATFNNE
ncbi:MAG: LysM domain-containing protein [Bacilli bacterium]|nr:LysM domain-containing protein [Bacilli bacterium]